MDLEFRKKTVRDVDVKGKTVLVRVDYNVPMQGEKIVEDMRIQASLPTINYLLENGVGKIVLISHLGRPEGQVDARYSLMPCAKRLGELLPGRTVRFINETVGERVKTAVADLPAGGIILLENLRFSPNEEADSDAFAGEIVESTGAEIFVQDGFAVIHRAHASTHAIAKRLPAVAGFLLEKEVSSLEKTLTNPDHSVLVIIGGAKVEDKAPLIETFLPIADEIMVGGKIAADGYRSTDDKIYVAEDFTTNNEGAKLDIGRKSAIHIAEAAMRARTIIWNGTLGMVEEKDYEAGSLLVAKAIGHNEDAFSVIGGGDTAAYVQKVLAREPELKFSLISTGGGASLELLSGKKLPGMEILQDR